MTCKWCGQLDARHLPDCPTHNGPMGPKVDTPVVVTVGSKPEVWQYTVVMHNARGVRVNSLQGEEHTIGTALRRAAQDAESTIALGQDLMVASVVVVRRTA